MKRLFSIRQVFYLPIFLFLVFSIVFSLTTCGGGGGGGGGDSGGTNTPPPTTSADAAAAVQATIMTQETTTASTVNTNLLLNAGSDPNMANSLSQANSANSFLGIVQGFQLLALQSTPVQTSAAGGGMSIFAAGNSWTWTATSGNLTITFRMSETTTSNYDWSLTLNGTYNGTTYNNYSFASGQESYGTGPTGGSGWHMTMSIRPVPANPLLYIFVDMWSYDDGSSAGYIDLNGLGLPYYYSWTESVDGTMDTALWQGAYGSSNKLLGLIINPDGSGSFEGFCPDDWNKAVDGTFTGFGVSGTACGYPTACDTTASGCGSWP